MTTSTAAAAELKSAPQFACSSVVLRAIAGCAPASSSRLAGTRGQKNAPRG